jgi:cytochrome P450
MVDRRKTADSLGDLSSIDDVFDEQAHVSVSTGGRPGDVRDPYPGYAVQRRVGAVSRSVLHGPDGPSEVYDVWRYPEVDEVFRDNETFSSGAIRELMELVMGPYVLVGMDEPEHRRHRNLVSQAFRQRALVEWESDFVDVVVNRLIDRFADRGHADLVREFTFRFPVMVIAGILGVPPSDSAEFHQYATAIVNVAADPERGFAASAAMREYLTTIVETRRTDPQDDVISDLVRAELDGERLGDEEIYSFLRLLLPAGAETTYRATGNFLFGLLADRSQWEALRTDRALMPQAIEEAVRWESPLTLTSRLATRDVELGGIQIPAGGHVVAHIGSANRDETRWERPDRFDVFREQKPHISFAAGPHMCLGMHLARMEMRSAVNALLDRLPDMRLDPAAEDVHIHGEVFRSPLSLPVVF